MSRWLLLTLLGLALIALGLMERGWWVLVVWPGLNFVGLGIAHAAGAHRLFGKRANGSLPLWSWIIFFPMLIYTSGVWHLIRLLSREASQNRVTDGLVVGRRLLPSEVVHAVDHYIDLTAEFAEPRTIRESGRYRSFPILDGAAPNPEALAEAVDRWGRGTIFIHCAQGHGRTGLFALAVLLRSAKARTLEEGLRMLQQARPGIRLSRAQRRCIEAFAVALPSDRSQGREVEGPNRG